MPRPWQIVPDEEVPDKTPRWSHPNEEEFALSNGKTLFVPGPRISIVNTGKTAWLAMNGYQVHSRKGNRNGEEGVYWWTTSKALFREDGTVNE